MQLDALLKSRHEHPSTMMAVLEDWDENTGCHRDHMKMYTLIVLSKFGLDVLALWLYSHKRLRTSLLGMFSLTVVLADLVMVSCTVPLWLLGPDKISACYLLAFASVTYGTLPLPMAGLCLLEYFFKDTWRTSYKVFKNMTVTLLLWIFAVVYSYSAVNVELMELRLMSGKKVLVCEVQDTTLVAYCLFGLLGIVSCSMLPFCHRIPQWIREADRLCDAREAQENQLSDLFISTHGLQTTVSDEFHLKETTTPKPPLWFSLTLGFAMFWMPYLITSSASLVFGFWIPAYVAVNLLWLECTNSVIVGLMFWAKSRMQGPYAKVPENVFSLEVYWHLSNGKQSGTKTYTPLTV
ncbi:uncharacterized protein si:dkeyp-100a1.6 [Entelurus aequoreus]|uniref:uncharacterized protein si:dkeyp-100a1.6 n=1 Tax=Entelurus aequoreus TaxID=161455 RepID=UPI002B1D35C8|nr:uncharacterized protein si:dkeyp-100a1.6 [Entelurus aequoreus]XP_061908248.1 uncharacterized protein si:dkeyp-100a1.6 [Entelurus aequoreus]